jgi:hypothetical protein
MRHLLWNTSYLWFGIKILFIIFLFMKYYKFVNLSVKHRIVSIICQGKT